MVCEGLMADGLMARMAPEPPEGADELESSSTKKGAKRREVWLRTAGCFKLGMTA